MGRFDAGVFVLCPRPHNPLEGRGARPAPWYGAALEAPMAKFWKKLFGGGSDRAGGEVAAARERAVQALEALAALARELGDAPAVLVAAQTAVEGARAQEERGEGDPASLVATYDGAWRSLLQGRTELLFAHPARMARDYVAAMGESAEDIENPTARTFAFLQLAALHSVQGDADEERFWLDRALASVSDGESVTAAMNSLQTVGALGERVDAAWATSRCEDLRERIAQWGDPIEEVAAVNELVRGRAALGDVEGALAWARDVEDPWYREHAAASVLEAMAGKGKVDEAEALLEELTDPALRGAAQKSLAAATARTGNHAAGRDRAAAIADPEWRNGALREVAEIQAQAGGVEGARALADAIPCEKWRADARRGIAEARALAGDAEHALQVVASMEDGGSQLACLAEVAQILADRGEFDAVRRIAEAVDHPGTRVFLLGALAQGLVRHGQPAQGAEALDLALEVAAGARKEVPLDALLAALVEVRAHTGDVEDAIEAAEGIAQPNARAAVYHRVAKDLVAAGEVGQLAGLETLCREPLGRTWFLLGAVTTLLNGK